MGVKFEANPTGFAFKDFGSGTYMYDPAFHEIGYEWDFGDNRAPWKYVRLPTEFNNPSKGYGKMCGHVYTTPGTYTVTCTARQIVSLDPLVIIEATATSDPIVVADVDDIFDETNTIYCDFTNDPPDFTGVPAGFTTTNDIGKVTRSTRILAQTVGKVRLRFKAGDNRNIFREVLEAERGFSTADVIRVDSWGGGKAILQSLVVGGSPGVSDTSLILTDVHVKGYYDPTLHTFVPNTEESREAGRIGVAGAGYKILHDIEASNGPMVCQTFSSGYSELGILKPMNLFVDDCHFYDRFDYGFLMNDAPGDFYSFTGYAYVPAPDQMQISITALTTGQDPVTKEPLDPQDDPEFPIWKTHSVAIRTWHAGKYYIDGLDGYSRCGWSGGNPFPDGSEVAPGIQPVLRLAGDYTKIGDPVVSETIDDPGTAYVTRCVLEGAFAMSMRTIRELQGFAINNTVFDGNLCIGMEQTDSFIASYGSALTVRNNVFIKPPTDQFGLRNILSAFPDMQGQEKDPPAPPTPTPPEQLKQVPVQIYSNTIAALHDPNGVGKSGGNFVMGDFTNLQDTLNGPEHDHQIVFGNTVYGPLHDTTQEGLVENYTPDTSVLFPPRYIGRRVPTNTAPEGELAFYVNGPMTSVGATPTDVVAWYSPEDGIDPPTEPQE